MQTAWQKYALKCFPEDQFVDMPPEIQALDKGYGMWRFKTHKEFLEDTIGRCGCIASTCLSLLFKPKVIVEMGVNAGWTSLLLSKLNPNAEVHGVDIREYISDKSWPVEVKTGYVVEKHKCPNYTLHIGDSSKFKMKNVDLCFIDGDHEFEGCLNDCVRAWENRNVNGDWCIAFDDYHPHNKGVTQAVDMFCAEVGFELQKIASWFWIGTKTMSENDLANIGE